RQHEDLPPSCQKRLFLNRSRGTSTVLRLRFTEHHRRVPYPILMEALRTDSRSSQMIYRTLGHTGEKVSVIGLGGSHIGKANLSDKAAIRIIRTAIDAGMNFM